MKQQEALWGICVCGIFFLLFVVVFAFCFGSVSLSAGDVWRVFFGQSDPFYRDIVIQLRLPRILMAGICGASLALAGLVFQTILRNPLAEPYILGISGGAAVGNILGVLAGLALFARNMTAFAGGITVLLLLLILRGGRSRVESLLLSGVMINAFCGAVVMFLISLLDADSISSVVFWFMGNLAGCPLPTAYKYIAVLLPFCLVLACSGHVLNLILLGEEAATSLGLAAGKIMIVLLVVVSLMTSCVVAAVGPLGFVGLVVPQMLHLVIGADRRLLAPACVFFGAGFLVGCDLLARVALPHEELPSGVITALIGAPVFVLLQRRKA